MPAPRHFFTLIEDIVIDPASSNQLYVPTSDGIFMSNDGGFTWELIKTDSTDALSVDPQSPATIYAASGKVITRSLDGGSNWSALYEGNGAVNLLAIDPAKPDILYAATEKGVLKSDDSGDTWSIMNQDQSTRNVLSFCLDPKDGATLYAGTEGYGLFKYSYLPEEAEDGGEGSGGGCFVSTCWRKIARPSDFATP